MHVASRQRSTGWTQGFWLLRTGGGYNNATISYSDGPSNTLFFSTPLPTDVVVTDYIVVNGAAYGSGNTILGIKAWDVNSNTGTIGGLNRNAYPGRLSTPTINLNGAALTPGIAQRAEVLLTRALGPDAESLKSGVWYGPLEQAFARLKPIMFRLDRFHPNSACYHAVQTISSP